MDGTITDATIDVDGVATHYHEAGSGPDVLLIHGSGPGVSALANWRFLIPELARDVHVLAPDLLGFGYSERPPGAAYGKALWLDHVRGFLEAKGVKRCSIVGNSMGGAIALAYAIRYPDRVDRMLLMGTVGVPFPITPGLEAVWSYRPDVDAMRSLIADYFAFDKTIATGDLVQMRYEASVQPGFQESYEAMFPAPRQRHVDALASDPADIAKIEAPVLLVHGREDRVIPLDVSLQLLQLIPNAQLHVFGQCGHWTQLEKKSEFNAVARMFLHAS